MNHTKLGLLVGTALTFGVGNANAAPYNWTGFYIGGNAGYSWGEADTDVAISPIVGLAGSTSNVFPGDMFSQIVKPKGFIGGVQLGHNWQVGSWVYGWETDFQGSRQKNTRQHNSVFLDVDCTTTCDFFSTTDITAKLSWFGTTRTRMGMDWDGLLYFVTGGAAYGKVRISGLNTILVDVDQDGSIDDTVVTGFSYSKTRGGWTAGGGVEGATGINNWTWRVEYLYIDLGTAKATFGGEPDISVASRVTDHIVRFGLNLRP